MEQYKKILRLLTQTRQAHDYAQRIVNPHLVREQIMEGLDKTIEQIQSELTRTYRGMTLEELDEAETYVKSGEYMKTVT